MTNSGLNYVEDSNKARQYDTHYAITNSISSTEPSLHSQPSPSSDYEEYLLRCEAAVLFFFFIIILHHFFLRSVSMLLLVVFLSIYQSRTIQPIATTAIMIPAWNNKVLIPSTNPAVGSSGYCEAHSSKWLSASSPVNV
jgi:hypothetical protein